MTDRASPSPDLIDPTDPYAREHQTFPRLEDDLVARVAAYGSEELVPDGTLLFERGQRGADFFVVLDGTVEIFEIDRMAPSTSSPCIAPTNSPARWCSSTTARSWSPAALAGKRASSGSSGPISAG